VLPALPWRSWHFPAWVYNISIPSFLADIYRTLSPHLSHVGSFIVPPTHVTSILVIIATVLCEKYVLWKLSERVRKQVTEKDLQSLRTAYPNLNTSMLCTVDSNFNGQIVPISPGTVIASDGFVTLFSLFTQWLRLTTGPKHIGIFAGYKDSTPMVIHLQSNKYGIAHVVMDEMKDFLGKNKRPTMWAAFARALANQSTLVNAYRLLGVKRRDGLTKCLISTVKQ